jgi:hypothetical protein
MKNYVTVNTIIPVDLWIACQVMCIVHGKIAALLELYVDNKKRVTHI